jgi:hypothetical protein
METQFFEVFELAPSGEVLGSIGGDYARDEGDAIARVVGPFADPLQYAAIAF